MMKIKVVFVVHHLVCGGVDQALFDLINLLDKERFEPVVFVQNPGGQWEPKFRDAGITLVYDYSCRRQTMNPVVKAQNQVKKFQIRLAYRLGGAGLLDICCPDADVVVAYDVWENEKMVFTQNAKTVKYIHGDIGTFESYRRDILQMKDFLEKYDRIVCVSQAACDSFRKFTGLTKGVVMHHNPLNSDNVRRLAAEPIHIPTDQPLICSVGRLAPEKGLERLILVHKRLVDQGIDHRLIIVGDGPDKPFLQRLVRAVGTESRVIFTGYQANPYPYMKASRFLVNSSFTEGLPVIAMESLCLGVPVVATIPSVAEVFGGDFCGLITQNNQDSLLEGIARMLTDQAFYARAKTGAQKRSTCFDGKIMISKIEQMFQELVEQ